MKLAHKFILILCLTPLVILGKAKEPNWPEIYTQKLFSITEVMVTDVASPPVAARIYAYSTLASYVTMQSQGENFKNPSLLNFANLSESALSFEVERVNSPEFSAIYAMLKVGEAIMPSGYLLKEKQQNWIEESLKAKIISKKTLQTHLDLANQIATQIIGFTKKDGYLQLSALNRYTPVKGEGYWFPTPPAYIAAVEPEWKTVQPFFIKDLALFKPEPMAPFSLEVGSSFRIQVDEVYEATQQLTEEQKLIANFWDCNPFKVEFSGHMSIGVKKISPGGHWMGITGIAAQKAKLGFSETAYIHALVGMTLHDAFISCWKEKYESNRIRPETVINQNLDEKWKPLLQTPPFPEYTSGHSVISAASSVVLTHYFGDNFDFIDTSEIYFGLPERQFSSFYLAADEAAISRLYGGIHFRDAIEQGVIQGRKIGEMIVSKTGLSEHSSKTSRL